MANIVHIKNIYIKGAKETIQRSNIKLIIYNVYLINEVHNKPLVRPDAYNYRSLILLLAQPRCTTHIARFITASDRFLLPPVRIVCDFMLDYVNALF